MCVCVCAAVVSVSLFLQIQYYVEKSPSVKVHRVTDPLLFLKYTFNFSQTVGEMVFISFEVEKMRMFLV